MLILTRRVSEVVCIGDDIQITILRVHGNQVRIGIEAPKELPVHREEVHERILAERARKSGIAVKIKGLKGGNR